MKPDLWSNQPLLLHRTGPWLNQSFPLNRSPSCRFPCPITLNVHHKSCRALIIKSAQPSLPPRNLILNQKDPFTESKKVESGWERSWCWQPFKIRTEAPAPVQVERTEIALISCAGIHLWVNPDCLWHDCMLEPSGWWTWYRMNMEEGKEAGSFQRDAAKSQCAGVQKHGGEMQCRVPDAPLSRPGETTGAHCEI